MSIQRTCALAAAGLVGALLATPASAYEVIAVENPGKITGTVKFAGDPPAPEKFQVTKDTGACGTEKTKEDLLVGADKGIANVVVKVNASKGAELKPADKKITFDQKGCQYKPHVTLVPAGSTLEVLNPDGVLHNVHVMGKANPEKNQAMPKFRKTLDWKVDKPEWPVEVKCDAHPWMKAYWVVMDTPYYAVTDEKGSFTIDNLPAGEYDVEVWQETLGKKTEKVTVTAGSATDVAWEMSK
jgi:plastocyanin